MNLNTAALVQLMAHKKWMDMGLYDALESSVYGDKPDAVQQALYWLNHIHIVDQIFQAHMLGQPHSFTSTESSTFAPLPELRRSAVELDGWLMAYAQGMSDAAAAEEIDFVFTDGDPGRMSRAQMLMHLASHGLYHLGVTTQALASEGLPTPPLLLTTYLNQARKEVTS